jgi:hypothetical protein
MPEDAVVAGDAGWAHGRAAMQAQTTLICLKSGRVVATAIVQMRRHIKRGAAGNVTVIGDFNGSPQACDGEGYRRIGAREMQRPNGGKIRLIVTDRENAVPKIITELGLPWRHVCDANHVIKAVQARFDEFESYRPLGRKYMKRVLASIHASLFSWFHACAKLAGTDDEKQLMWLGAIEHYTRPASQWEHKDDPLAVECLRGFVLAVAPELCRYQKEHSTNPVESLNSLRVKKAGKDFAWMGSWLARAFSSVLEQNEGAAWVLGFCEWLGIPLPPGFVANVLAETADNFDERARRGTEEFRHAQQAARVAHKTHLSSLALRNRKREVVHDPPRAVKKPMCVEALPDEGAVRAAVGYDRADGDNHLESRRNVGVAGLRCLSRSPPASRWYAVDSQLANVESLGFHNEDRTSCHLGAALRVILAAHPAAFCAVTGDGDSDDLWRILLRAQSEAVDEDVAISLVECGFRQCLERMPGFAAVDAEIGPYLGRYRPPGDTFQRLMACLAGVQCRSDDRGCFTLGDLFRTECAVFAAGVCGEQRIPDDVRFILDIADSASIGGDDGDRTGLWILNGSLNLGHERRVFCARCRKEHRDTVTRVFTRLPEFLMLDFDNEGPSRAGGMARVPIVFGVREASPDGGAIVRYALAAFVEVSARHARAFIRIGPAHFSVFNDSAVEWARVAEGARCIKAHATLAMFRAIARE